jgi:hypothetical protein
VNQSHQTPPEGPGIGLTFLYYFAGSAAIGTLLASQILHIGLGTGIPNQLGVLVGLLGGGVGTYFNRTLSLEVPMRGRKALLNRLNPILADMGYILAEDSEDGLTYQRSQLRGLFSGKIYVYWQERTATLISRAVHIRALKKRLNGA